MGYLVGILIFVVVFSLLWTSWLGTQVAIWVYAKGDEKLSSTFRKWEDRVLYLFMGIMAIAVLNGLYRLYGHIMLVLNRGM